MAVDIDTVYQTVLALANKEQRGYITPQEFNLFANHAQKEIFEQYFYDKNRVAKIPGNQSEFSDLDRLLDEKIQIFQLGPIAIPKNTGVHIYPASLWRLGTVISHNVEATEIDERTLLSIISSPLIKPTAKNPVYIRKAGGIVITPFSSKCHITYIATPTPVKWGYFVVGNKPLYDNSAAKTTHFDLHPSEESELVYKILKLAGIGMKRIDIAQAGQIQEQSQQQQEKQ